MKRKSFVKFVKEIDEKELKKMTIECFKNRDFLEDVKKLAKSKRFQRIALKTIGGGALIVLGHSIPALAMGQGGKAVTSLLSPGSLPFAVAGPGNIDVAGRRFWSYIKTLARWGCIICGALEMLKTIREGDTKSAIGIALKYGVAYAVVVGMPWLFDEIDLFFS